MSAGSKHFWLLSDDLLSQTETLSWESKMAWPCAGYFVVDVQVSTLSLLQGPQEELWSRKALCVYTGALGFHLWYDFLNLGVEPSACTGSVWVLVGSFLHSCQNWESPMCSSTELLGEELRYLYLWNLSECILESCSDFVQLFCHLENMKLDVLHVWPHLIRPACKSFVRPELHVHSNAPWGSARSPGSCKLRVKGSSVKDAVCDHACIHFRSVNHRVYCSEC